MAHVIVSGAGLGGIPAAFDLRKHLAKNHRVTLIGARPYVEFTPSKKKEHKLPFAHSAVIPAFKGVDAVAAVPGLCNPRGFVLIDKHQRSPKYSNIFSVGVCVAIPAVAEATWNAICLADFGDMGAAFVALPQIPPRNVTWSKKGKWVHLAKIAFEKYFLRKIRTGSLTPVYETYVLKALGIVSLKRRAG